MVPVVLFTGFLGSGKTTLLNRLLSTKPDSVGRVAIIVNEFGDVGIDGDLLPSEMTRQVELPGGCICCVLNEDLDTTLLELLATERDLHTIVIETTGIAEPLPISWSLARAPLCEQLRLAAVVTVVDALRHAENRMLSPSADAQVEYADLLVVSKLDLLGKPCVDAAALAALRALNANAPVLQESRENLATLLWSSLADPALAEPTRSPEPSHAGHSHRHHDLESVSFDLDKTFDLEELSESLESLPASYWRIKGIAQVVDGTTGSDEPHYVVFHRVGARVSSEPLARAAKARVIALGRAIDAARLAACFDSAVVP